MNIGRAMRQGTSGQYVGVRDLSLIVTDGPELFLNLTPDEPLPIEVVFYLLWFSAEGIAQ